MLLLQLNGDLPDRFPGHERRLYVFSCRRKACRRKEGSIRALRATRVSAGAAAQAKARREQEERERAEKEKSEAERREKEKGLGEALFGVQKGAFGASAGSNPFSTAGGGGVAVNPFAKPPSGAAANPFSSTPVEAEKKPASPAETAEETKDAANDLPRTFAETLSLDNPQKRPPAPPAAPEPWPPESELPAPYPVSYLAEADYETLDPQPAAPAQNVRVMDVDEPAGSSRGGASKEDKDVFESSIDATFQKFADRLSQNPEQCIRYEFGGQPLLYSKTDTVGKVLHDVTAAEIGRALPRCGGCGGARTFEVQLTPRAIVELEEGEGEGVDMLGGMDWGTVVVGVCERDCVPGATAEGEMGYMEEWTGVQWEELTARR